MKMKVISNIMISKWEWYQILSWWMNCKFTTTLNLKNKDIYFTALYWMIKALNMIEEDTNFCRPRTDSNLVEL